MGMAFDSAPFNEDIHMCQEFLDLKNKFKIKNVVETGTYKGVTTKWLGQNFDRVFTTEIVPLYHEEAKAHIGNMPNVTCVLGDVQIVLPEVLKSCDNRTIIFEDCHWYKNPVVGELQILKNSGLKPILVLHDMKNPNHPDFGYDTYPDQGIVYEWDWIKPHVDAIYGEGEYKQYYNDRATGAKRGAIFIIPNWMIDELVEYVNHGTEQTDGSHIVKPNKLKLRASKKDKSKLKVRRNPAKKSKKK